MAIGPGSRVGPYEITGLLGEGGMGQVYQATDTNLKRPVAIKVLPATVATDPDRLTRFQREAEVLARLNHPNIAQIFGIERRESADSGPILVMELVEGPTLADVISSAPGHSISLEEALPLAKQITAALEAAHEQGIVHRDLKPANIKVRPDGAVKVLDFGLAKAMEPASALSPSHSVMPTITSPAMTQAGVILGTAAYMSPEQAKGRAVDARADIWAFGAVLYEMLSGRRAFDGEDMTDVLGAVVRLEPDWNALPNNLPPRVRRVIQTCLKKNVKERFAHVQDVRLALEGAFETEVVRISEPAAVASRPVRFWQRPIAIGSLALISAALAGLAAWTLRPSPVRPITSFVASTSPDAPFLGQSVNLDLAISPDGRTVVYSSGAAADRRLFVRPLDRLEGTTTLGGVTGSDTPFFSPDGLWVGFCTQSDTSWKKVSILGGPPVTLWDSPSPPRGATWLPDDTIIFAQATATTGLYRGSAAGGEFKVLTTPDAAKGEVNHWWPEALPGGRAILFTIVKGGRDQDREIAVLDLETGVYRTLMPGGSNPRYAPSGHIVYGTENTLRAVAFDVSRLTVTGSPVPVVEGVMMKTLSGAVNFGLSRTGALVYARGGGTAFATTRQFVWVDQKGTETALDAEPQEYQEFTLSPDGSRIAVRLNDPENPDVWVYDIARNTSTRLTFDDGVELFPLWSPNGTRVAFGAPQTRLSWKAADGTGAVEAIGEPNELPNAFSPDGTKVVFETRGDGNDLGVRALTGEGGSQPLVEGSFATRNAAISRDGHWLAYQSNESGEEEIYVRPFPDVNAGRWQVSSGGGAWPVWSPVRNELFYRGPQGVMRQIYDAEPTFTPRARSRLFEWNFDGVSLNSNRRMAIAPDGQRFLFLKTLPAAPGQADAPPAEVVVVDNWLEELKRLVPTK